MALYETRIAATPAAAKQYGATSLTIGRAKVTRIQRLKAGSRPAILKRKAAMRSLARTLDSGCDRNITDHRDERVCVKARCFSKPDRYPYQAFQRHSPKGTAAPL